MEVYVARQAIFNERKQVVAYELLFRSNTINQFVPTESSNATLNVIKNSFSIIGIDKLTEGKTAFINFDEALIKSGIIESFPKDLITVEILETVNPDEKTIEMCKKLKEKGYTIALDDFEYSDKYKELIKLVDIIKVDFLLTKGAERKDIIKRIKSKTIKFLAEKVETEEDYKEAVTCGYSLFQGYFFCKPVIVSGRDISAYKFTYIKLVQALGKEEVDINEVEKLVKSDVSLSYKLLKVANSAQNSLKNEITSIRAAIMLIGMRELKRWLFIITLKSMDIGKPEELIKMSLIRASFGEVLVKKLSIKGAEFDMFLIGLFSLMDALLNRPIQEILSELPVSQVVKDALTGKDNVFKNVLELIIEYEKGNWLHVNRIIKKMSLTEEDISSCYLEAIECVQRLNIA